LSIYQKIYTGLGNLIVVTAYLLFAGCAAREYGYTINQDSLKTESNHAFALTPISHNGVKPDMISIQLFSGNGVLPKIDSENSRFYNKNGESKLLVIKDERSVEPAHGFQLAQVQEVVLVPQLLYEEGVDVKTISPVPLFDKADEFRILIKYAIGGIKYEKTVVVKSANGFREVHPWGGG